MPRKQYVQAFQNSNFVVVRIRLPTCSSEHLSEWEDTEPELSVSPPELFSEDFFFHNHFRSI